MDINLYKYGPEDLSGWRFFIIKLIRYFTWLFCPRV